MRAPEASISGLQLTGDSRSRALEKPSVHFEYTVIRLVRECAHDAANYFWRLALEMVAAPAPSDLGPAEALRRNEALASNFWELRRRADIYYAYSYIHSYIQEPFTTLLPEHVFNCALYLWNILASSGFSAQPVQSLLAQVQGGPEAEAAYLEKVRMDAVQGGAQQSRGHLKEDDLLPVCNWCMTTNPLLRSNLDSCTNCGHPFIRTFLGFDILPLVEFGLRTDIALQEAQDLIEQEPHARKSQNSDGWHESTRGGAEVMSLSEGPMPGDEAGTDLFVQKMLDAASYFVPGEPYQPVKIDRETLAELRPEEVYVADFRKYSPLLPVRFFRSMIPEVAIAVCNNCGNFFHQAKEVLVVRDLGAGVSTEPMLPVLRQQGHRCKAVIRQKEILPSIAVMCVRSGRRLPDETLSFTDVLIEFASALEKDCAALCRNARVH
ncbi:Intraflagellar transport protein 122-like [Symbiodinium microadriaticum]|uniref:Intraflagellar transport protein 122-like n=1 Tax=Symbiodinium microadriaticum TaxID=2951 RepID=A0A1Q9C056_SYMMI|nr:Intraflagellar transport protein 122-like [Symbiodinium microadriaticum]